ncbi:MAG: complex I NDUFA9 subunit family protein [Terricaulis sp.]
MTNELVVVFGGSGFVGKQVVRALAKKGYRIRVPMRRPHLGADLRVLGDVGQVQLVQANVRFPDSVDAALEGADAVVNLVSVINSSGKQTFNNLHVEAARTIAERAEQHGVTKFVQVSALGAASSGARYYKTKFAGEKAVRESVPAATVLRPSIIFGPEDHFFNRFAGAARFASFLPFGGLPMFGGGKTKMQPVFVGDVAAAIVAAIARDDARGKTYELGGPRTYSFKELMQFMRTEIDRKFILPFVPFVIGYPLALVTDWAFKLNPLMQTPVTGDQVMMMTRDSVVGADANAGKIQDLGITSLESVESIAPTYLWRYRPYGQFQTKQNEA